MEPLTEEELKTIWLPKWPQFVVVGERVTKEQAAEIIIRTSGLYFSCNDHAWEKQLKEYLGVEEDWLNVPEGPNRAEEMWWALWDKEDAKRDQLGVLRLGYLANHQIASASIGGPSGWVDWEGNVGCYSYNIGKWPSTEEVLEDWRKIAEAWPYLKLRSQLYSAEQCEEHGRPLVEYRVAEGRVQAFRPEAPLPRVHSGVRTSDIHAQVQAIAYAPTSVRERGCTFEQFCWAVDLVREKMEGKDVELAGPSQT